MATIEFSFHPDDEDGGHAMITEHIARNLFRALGEFARERGDGEEKFLPDPLNYLGESRRQLYLPLLPDDICLSIEYAGTPFLREQYSDPRVRLVLIAFRLSVIQLMLERGEEVVDSDTILYPHDKLRDIYRRLYNNFLLQEGCTTEDDEYRY